MLTVRTPIVWVRKEENVLLLDSVACVVKGDRNVYRIVQNQFANRNTIERQKTDPMATAVMG